MSMCSTATALSGFYTFEIVFETPLPMVQSKATARLVVSLTAHHRIADRFSVHTQVPEAIWYDIRTVCMAQHLHIGMN